MDKMIAISIETLLDLEQNLPLAALFCPLFNADYCQHDVCAEQKSLSGVAASKVNREKRANLNDPVVISGNVPLRIKIGPIYGNDCKNPADLL